MDDFYSVQLEPSYCSRERNSQEKRCRDLIAAIIYQAFIDAKYNNLVGAKHFIDVRNQTFVMYCELLDYDPEFIADKLQKGINEKNGKKRKTKNEDQIRRFTLDHPV